MYIETQESSEISQRIAVQPFRKPSETGHTLYEFYNSIFEGVVADTEALVDECYRLRYQTYCLENTGYEDASAFPDSCERDEYDRHSVHALLRHRPSKTFVGTVRLILNRFEHKDGSFPIDKICADHGLALPLLMPRHSLGEISRFSISKTMRRRVTDTVIGSSYSPEEMALNRARVIPCMALGLMTMVNQISRHHGVDHYCAVMEPPLLRLLSKLGMHFRAVGPLIDFHGNRQVCYATVDEMRQSLEHERPDVLEVLTDRGRYP